MTLFDDFLTVWVYLFGGSMLEKVVKTQEPDLLKMLAEIREKHIDIIPIIKEELLQAIRQCIEETIKNIYHVKVEGI